MQVLSLRVQVIQNNVITVETLGLAVEADVELGRDDVKRGRGTGKHEALVCVGSINEVDQRLLIVQVSQIVADELEAHLVEELPDIQARLAARLVE